MNKFAGILALLLPLCAMAQEIPVTEPATGASEAIQYWPAMTRDARGFLIAWRESNRLHFGGVTFDGARRPEHSIETPGNVSDVTIAVSGEQSLLAWFQSGRVHAQRFDADGAPAGPNLDLGYGGGPAVAAVPGGFRIAFTDTFQYRITSLVIGFDGTVGARTWLETPGEQSPAPRQEEPVCDVPQGAPLLAWNDQRASTSSVVISRVDANGLRVGDVTTLADGEAIELAMACGPLTCLVAWFERDRSVPREEDVSDAPIPMQLQTALVTSDGQLVRVTHDIAPFTRGAWVSVPLFVAADPLGAFTVMSEKTKVEIGSNGEVRSVLPWTAHDFDLGGVTRHDGFTWVVYGRDGRVYVRRLASTKLRAVR